MDKKRINECIKAYKKVQLEAHELFGYHSKEYIELLSEADTLNVDLFDYLNREKPFTIGQLKQIMFGLSSKVNINKYAFNYFNEDQMNEIRRGLEDKVNVDFYAKRKYGYKQMSRARLKLKDGIPEKDIYL